MKAMYAALEVEAAVKNHSRENIPESEKGKINSSGKHSRGAGGMISLRERSS
jgi:hypothetical protein